MLDGELAGDIINPTEIEPVHMSNVTLTLSGTDLLDDPSLRQGLVNLWVAEAETAGLEIASLHSIGTGVRDAGEGYALAELSSGGERMCSVPRSARTTTTPSCCAARSASRPSRGQRPTTEGA